MIESRQRGLLQLLVMLQIIGAGLIFIFIALGLQAWRDVGTIPFRTHAMYGSLALSAMVLEAISRPSYLRPGPGRMKRIAAAVSRRQLIASLGAIGLMAFFSRDESLSRIFLLVCGASFFVFFLVTNAHLPRWFSELGLKHFRHWKLRTIILGPREWCDSVGREITCISSLLDVRGVHAMEDQGSDPASCMKLVADGDVDLVVMPPRHMPYELVASMMRQGDRLGYRCWMPLEITRRYGRRFDLQRVGQLDMLTPPTEPLDNTVNRVLKRLFDIAVSVPVVLLVLPPLCLMVKLIHLKYSPGPLFFCQERMGMNGSKFQVIKFRTLHMTNEAESRQVTKSDPRVFRGGRLLRKLSIDEIPQFLNVLLGEMSVVGPRPHMEEHDFRFREIFERYGVRRYVKPGVTGLAQAKGFRGEVNRPRDLRHRARLDAFYVSHWDLTMDVRIVAWTLLSVMSPPKSAY